MELLEIAKKRKATKEYNGKKIDLDTLNYIFEVINTAPTSMGLEHWRVISLRDNKLKEKLKDTFLFNDKRMMQSSDALIFITKTKEWFDTKNKELKSKVERTYKAVDQEYGTSTLSEEQVNNTLNYIHNADHGNNNKDLTEWSKRQAYIASGYAMLAAMEKNINSTPLEGFSKELTEKLRNENLIDKNENVAIVILLGYIDGVEHPTHGKIQLREKVENQFKII